MEGLSVYGLASSVLNSDQRRIFQLVSTGHCWSDKYTRSSISTNTSDFEIYDDMLLIVLCSTVLCCTYCD